MPRQSPFNIVLRKAERAELLERSRRYTSRYRDVICAKIVLLASEGMTNDSIAARLDTPRQIVSKWRRRFHLQRLAGLEERLRGGRPARFSPGVMVEIKALACELPSRRGPWPIGRSASCVAKLSSMAWSLTSAARRSGGGSARMRCGHGGIGAGFFRVTQLLPSRPAASSIFIIAVGTTSPWDRMIRCSVPMKNQQPGQALWSMNMPAPVPAPTWLPRCPSRQIIRPLRAQGGHCSF
jgi:transposase